jgi:5'/3'-nucleotidase SurE
LETSGHTVSVIIPDVQRSWIGKAHIVGQDVHAEPYWPPKSNPDTHPADAVQTTSNGEVVANSKSTTHPWILVNSTPATCAQLGLGAHFFSDREPIDLVISGPNYGRNTTAVFALSSGTLGAALEASVCGYRSIALSYAFFDRKNEPGIVAETSQHAVRVCEWLAKNADFSPARLYSVNVPVKKGVSQSKVVWTKMLQNQWKKGACFQEVPQSEAVGEPGVEEANIRRRESDVAAETNGKAVEGRTSEGEWQRRHFKWAPRFTDVYESVEKAGPGSDGWAVKAGNTSITALRANFMHVEGLEGEVKL